MVDDNYAIIQVGDSASMYAPVLASAFPYSLTGRTLNKDLLKPGCSVCIHPGSSAVVDILPPQADNDIKIMRPWSCPSCTPKSSPRSALTLLAE